GIVMLVRRAIANVVADMASTSAWVKPTRRTSFPGALWARNPLHGGIVKSRWSSLASRFGCNGVSRYKKGERYVFKEIDSHCVDRRAGVRPFASGSRAERAFRLAVDSTFDQVDRNAGDRQHGRREPVEEPPQG